MKLGTLPCRRPCVRGLLAPVLGLVVSATAALAEPPAPPAPLTVACLQVGDMLEACRAAATAWGKQTGHAVRVISAQVENNAALDNYENLFAVASDRVDVVQFPGEWVPVLAPDLIDLAPGPAFPITGQLPAALGLGRLGGRQVGAPMHLSVGVLLYRSDLVPKPPRTWQALEADAAKIAAIKLPNDKTMGGYLFPAAPSGGLAASALEWLAAAGVSIPDAAGRIAVDTPASRAAFDLVDSWVGEGVPPVVATLDDAAALQIFARGEAGFLRTWSDAYPALAATKLPNGGKFALAPLPALAAGAAAGPSTLRAVLFGVPRFSKQAALASQLVAYMAGPDGQKLMATKYAIAPSLVPLYDDADLLRAQPWLATIHDALNTLVVPPVDLFGVAYLEAVKAAANLVHKMIAGDADAATTLAALETALLQVRQRAINR